MSDIGLRPPQGRCAVPAADASNALDTGRAGVGAHRTVERRWTQALRTYVCFGCQDTWAKGRKGHSVHHYRPRLCPPDLNRTNPRAQAPVALTVTAAHGLCDGMRVVAQSDGCGSSRAVVRAGRC